MIKGIEGSVCNGRCCYPKERKESCKKCGKFFCKLCGIDRICKNCLTAFYRLDMDGKPVLVVYKE